MRRRERRALERRWRKEQRRAVPSPSAVFRYLSAFHDAQQEKFRQEGKAHIPTPNRPLQGLVAVNRDMLSFVQSRQEHKTATLDMEKTLVETGKESALYCYEHFKAYQPLNVRWSKQGVAVHTESRDGNVPAGYEQRRVLEEALASLPEGVEKVYLREDTAGYEWDLLTYCAEGKHERFGVIEFAIGADVTPEFKKAVAHGVMKEDLAGGKLPSGEFGENAAWWWIMMFELSWIIGIPPTN